MKESAIQKQILDFLAAKGILAFRMNSGLQLATYGGKKRAIRYGVPGMADVLAFTLRGVWPDGELADRDFVEPLWIECKAEKGKQSELQKSFQQQVESHGHRYVVARSVDEVLKALEGQ